MAEIEEGIHMPPGLATGAKLYHFEKMKVGDSMFFETFREVNSAQTSAYDWGLRHNKGFKVSRRKVEGGYRLWRIK